MAAEHQHPRSNRSHPRFRYREAAHQAAHAAAAEPPVHVPDHPLIPRTPGELITTPDALADLLAHIRQAGSFAYDSEFIGETSYRPKLCLLQVATAERVALIDPLAGLDLTGLWEMLADEAIEKVVHAGQQDMEPVQRYLGRPPANLFDTQIAAGFISLAYPVALGKLVKSMLGVSLGKGFTFTHWDQRPLSAVQLRYAADDVRFLPALRAAIGEQLAARGHTAWAREESAMLCDPALYVIDPERDYLRIRGAGTLSGKQLSVLRELTIWRDQAAQSADLPPRSFLKDDILIDLARKPIKAVEDLDKVRGLPRPVEHEHGATLLALTQRALSVPASEQPVVQHVEETPAERFRGDSLWATTQVLCAAQGIDPALVTSRQDLAQWHRAVLAGRNVDQHRLMCGWRRQAVGERLIKVLEGREALSAEWRDHQLRLRGE